jgi:LDH2 family malate/lactate/ureidoglycolate dehydrogenase
MQVDLHDAADLAACALSRHGMSAADARVVAEHLVDAALCGHEFSSLPRVLAIVDELRKKQPPGEIRIVREDGSFAHVDGGDRIAYVVSLVALDKAIAICRRHGVAVVTANNTWFSGRCSYYVERAAREGLVALHTTNTTARVAPFGGVDRLLGTNPFAIAFPSTGDPIVIDIGTSAITWGDVLLAREKGEPLPEGVAVDNAGRATLDPGAALEGAFKSWGGQRGAALAMTVQLLGVLGGSELVVRDTADFGLFFVLIDPRRLQARGDVPGRISEARALIAASRPAAGNDAVRMPGDGSQARRRQALARGTIEVDDRIYSRLLELSR